MCDLEAIGAPSIFKLMRSAAALARVCPTSDLSFRRTPRGENGSAGWIVQAELLKLQKRGQFPDEPAKIEGAQIHGVDAQT